MNVDVRIPLAFSLIHITFTGFSGLIVKLKIDAFYL